MIEFKTGDILGEDAEALVNTVNCVGFMGRGIALQFKRAYPENFKLYEAACRREEVEPGRMLVFETGKLTNPRYIINFPTKRHWRGKARMVDLEMGLDDLVRVIRDKEIRSIAVPPLGAGLGGLEWSEVRSRINRYLADLEGVRVVVFEPHSDSEPAASYRAAEVPKMTTGRAVLVRLMQRYLSGLLDPSVSLLEVHKLMYFMQEADEPLRLQFAKAPYGPYAANLRHVLQAIEGYYVSGYGYGGDEPDKPLQLVPGAIDDAQHVLAASSVTSDRFQRVSDLVEGFESPFGLELLATVHWVIKHDHPASEDDLLRDVYAWNDRKKRFTRNQILLAADVLRDRGWLN